MKILDKEHFHADEHPHIFDPSDVYRPDVDESKFRTFDEDCNDPRSLVVKKTYHDMHTYQTVEFVKEKLAKWTKFNHQECTVMEALEELNELVDDSDPDTHMPNIVHAFQTAEQLRRDYPNADWLHLTGLIHDLGKVMAFYEEPQWAIVGDTFVVGCLPAESVVYRKTSFANNPDLRDERYNTKLGMYKERCGLRNVLMSWGHDEYLYRVLVENKTKLPEEALYIIRFHSFYPWHRGDDYHFLTDEYDEKMLKWVRLFNNYDLYTKSADVPDIESLKPYYQKLIDKYLPGIIRF